MCLVCWCWTGFVEINNIEIFIIYRSSIRKKSWVIEGDYVLISFSNNDNIMMFYFFIGLRSSSLMFGW